VHSWYLAAIRSNPLLAPLHRGLESDVSDIQGGTTPEGIHLGAMTGTVDLVQRCYTGIEMRDEVLWLNPRLPGDLRSLRCTCVIAAMGSRSTSPTRHCDRVQTRMGQTAKIGFRKQVYEFDAGDVRSSRCDLNAASRKSRFESTARLTTSPTAWPSGGLSPQSFFPQANGRVRYRRVTLPPAAHSMGRHGPLGEPALPHASGALGSR